MSTPEQIRQFAAFHMDESQKTLARAIKDMEAGHQLLGNLRAAVALEGALAASTMEELAGEVERHAETRKRLLKLQWRKSQNRFIYNAPHVLVLYEESTRYFRLRSIETVSAARVTFHASGRGVPD